MQRKQEEDRQMRQLVQALQAALEREKQEVQSLREQVCGRVRRGLPHCHVQPPQGTFSVSEMV